IPALPGSRRWRTTVAARARRRSPRHLPEEQRPPSGPRRYASLSSAVVRAGWRRLAALPSELLDDPAGDAGAPAAELRWLVGVVVAPGMHHDRAALQVGALEPRRQHRMGGLPVLRDVQRRQVAEMAVAPGRAMPAGALRIQVAARSAGRGHFAVLFRR